MSSIAFCYNCKILFYKTSLLLKKCLLFQFVSFIYSFLFVCFTNRELSFCYVAVGLGESFPL